MITKTLALYQRQYTLKKQMLEELYSTALAEFPPGTKVRWIHSFDADRQPKYREGVIRKELYQNRWRACVETPKSGAVHRIEWHHLELVEPA